MRTSHDMSVTHWGFSFSIPMAHGLRHRPLPLMAIACVRGYVLFITPPKLSMIPTVFGAPSLRLVWKGFLELLYTRQTLGIQLRTKFRSKDVQMVASWKGLSLKLCCGQTQCNHWHHLVQAARCALYELGQPLKSVVVEYILKPHSLVPTVVSRNNP